MSVRPPCLGELFAEWMVAWRRHWHNHELRVKVDSDEKACQLTLSGSEVNNAHFTFQVPLGVE